MIEQAIQLKSQTVRFVQLVMDRFLAHRGLERASTLTYTTLLSLVPLMTVMLAILSAFPIAERVGESLQNFIFQNFVPASGELIQQYLSEFAGNAARLTGASFALLIFVAFLMMRDIDRTLNAIWETLTKRGTVNQFLIYWALLSLGPVLVALSLAVTSYLISLPLLVEAEQTFGLSRRLIGFAPVAASTLAFTLMYLLIPNCPVRLRHAAIGGFFAALLFEAAKRAFGFYVTSFPGYEAIYGALAVIPIFLVWVYLSWIIFLLGAELTHCLGIFHHDPVTTDQADHSIADVLTLLSRLHSAQKSGESVAQTTLDALQHNRLSPYQTDALLEKLAHNNLIARTENNQWILQQDLRLITLYDLLLKLDYSLPVAANHGVWEERLAPLFSHAHKAMHDSLDISLETLFQHDD